MLAISAGDDTFVSKAKNADALIARVTDYAVEATLVIVSDGQNGAQIVAFLQKYVTAV